MRIAQGHEALALPLGSFVLGGNLILESSNSGVYSSADTRLLGRIARTVSQSRKQFTHRGHRPWPSCAAKFHFSSRPVPSRNRDVGSHRPIAWVALSSCDKIRAAARFAPPANRVTYGRCCTPETTRHDRDSRNSPAKPIGISSNTTVSKKFSTKLANLRDRLRLYSRLAWWLLRTAASHFTPIMLLSAGCSLGSLFVQVFSLAIIAGAVGQFETHGSIVSFPALDRIGLQLPAPPVALVVVIFVILFATGGLLTFLGRSTAIRLESRFFWLFYRQIIEAVRASVFEQDVQRMRPERARNRMARTMQRLGKVLIADARFAGVAVRLMLYNISHAGNITIGIGIIAVLAPKLLPLIVLFGLVAGAGMYPLSLLGAQTTRQIEVHGPRRSAFLRQQLAEAMGVPDDADALLTEVIVDDDLMAESNISGSRANQADETVIGTYLGLVERRFRILETSKLIMAVLVGLGIGALLLFLLDDHSSSGSINYGSLIVLFFGFRFVFGGIEGAMVTLTSLNRFHPNVSRLYELMTEIDALKQRKADAAGS